MRAVLASVFAAVLSAGCSSTPKLPDGVPREQLTEAQIAQYEREAGARGHASVDSPATAKLSRYSYKYQKMYWRAYLELERADGLSDYDTHVTRQSILFPFDVVDAVNLGLNISGGTVLGPWWMSLIDFSYNHAYSSMERESWKLLHQAHLTWFKHVPSTGIRVGTPQYDEVLESVFHEGTVLVSSIPERCDIALRHRNPALPGTLGSHIIGYVHARDYLCGPSIDASDTGRGSNIVVSAGALPKPRYTVFGDLFSEHDLMGTVNVYIYGLPRYANQDGAKQLFADTKDAMPEGWYAVFTGPDTNGDWKVFVSDGLRTVAFDLPPEPGKK